MYKVREVWVAKIGATHCYLQRSLNSSCHIGATHCYYLQISRNCELFWLTVNLLAEVYHRGDVMTSMAPGNGVITSYKFHRSFSMVQDDHSISQSWFQWSTIRLKKNFFFFSLAVENDHSILWRKLQFFQNGEMYSSKYRGFRLVSGPVVKVTTVNRSESPPE